MSKQTATAVVVKAAVPVSAAGALVGDSVSHVLVTDERGLVIASIPATSAANATALVTQNTRT